MTAIPRLTQAELIASFLEHCQQKDCAAKQLILKEGEPSNDLYYIVSGAVTVLIEDAEGREIVLAYLNADHVVVDLAIGGELGLFDPNHQRSAFVRARTHSSIARISYEKIKNLHGIFPDLLFYIASQMGKRLCQTSRKVSDLAFTDVKGRVAGSLLDLCKQPDAMTHPDGMQIRITRQELGRIVGCSREMVGRVLKSLEEDHLISVSGKTMVIFGTR